MNTTQRSAAPNRGVTTNYLQFSQASWASLQESSRNHGVDMAQAIKAFNSLHVYGCYIETNTWASRMQADMHVGSGYFRLSARVDTTHEMPIVLACSLEPRVA